MGNRSYWIYWPPKRARRRPGDGGSYRRAQWARAWSLARSMLRGGWHPEECAHFRAVPKIVRRGVLRVLGMSPLLTW